MKIPIVDEQDNLLYYKDINNRDAHKEIIQITGLWIRNNEGKFLMTKRAKNKKYHPNIWGPSVSGTVEEGETYESNIRKETGEELGILLEKFTKGPKSRVSSSHEFFCQWFFANVPDNAQFTLQEDEVDEVKWITNNDMNIWYKKKPEEFVPNFDTCIRVLEKYDHQD